MDFHGFRVYAVNVPEVPIASLYTCTGDWLFSIPGVFLVIGLVLIHRKPRFLSLSRTRQT
jgi:hypothetical protein